MHQLQQILYRKNQQKLQHKIYRKDFRYAEGKSKFSEHVLNEGHEMNRRNYVHNTPRKQP